MITFTTQDNGDVPDRWPHTDADILPSIRINIWNGDIEIGHIIVTPERHRITNLFIEKAHRGKGYANALFDFAMKEFQITNFCASVYDGLDDVGRLISWHLKKGFVPSAAVEMVRKS